MKERPILFSPPMVRAILDGSKTQTRRIAPVASFEITQHDEKSITWAVRFDPPVRGTLSMHSGGYFTPEQANSIVSNEFCRIGRVGDRLWVRETHAHFYRSNARPEVRQREDVAYKADGFTVEASVYGCWKPSIHMPRWASRITLEITNVRVERLQDISEQDAIAEGCAGGHGSIAGYGYHATPQEHFAQLWQSINGAASWDANPWVWCITFQRTF